MTFSTGKAVKKWLGQGKDIHFISELLKKPITECVEAYYDYMGWNWTFTNSAKKIMSLIKKKKPIHIYGVTGSGKSFTIKAIAKHLKMDTIVSYATLSDELMNDWGELPNEEADHLFVLEGDAFYWRSYAMIKYYIQNAVAPIVIITTKKDKPTKWITKLVEQVKVFPPTREEMFNYLIRINPNWDGNIDAIYDNSGDMRVTWRNFLYNKRYKTPENVEKLDAKKVAYKILTGKASYSDFENCNHPWEWVIGWISYNCVNFYEGSNLSKVHEKLAWIDKNKFNYKKGYMIRCLLELPKADKKGYMAFPPFKSKKKEEDKQESDTIITKFKAQPNKKKYAKTTPVFADEVKEDDKKDDFDFDDDFGDFLLI